MPTNLPAKVRPRPRVLIVGAGFGGLSAARKLGKHEVDVLVLDRRNYHGFWPLIYEVATSGLEPESIAYPVRAILHKYRCVSFHMAEVCAIDFERKLVLTDTTPVSYDYLILAAGSTNNYFGNDILAANTFSLKDIDDAESLRNHVLTSFEYAVRENNPMHRSRMLTFVIVGGGPTGVELAGAFAELIRHVLHKDYPMLDVTEARVLLVEAAPSLLGTFSPSLQYHAQRQLEKMGVEVRLNTAVAAVDDGIVTFKDGTQIASKTVVWAAGVRAAHLAEVLGLKLERGFRIPVEPTLTLPGRPEVLVIGDMAHLRRGKSSQPYPMVATVAIQQGKCAAHNIMAQMRFKPMKPFRYFDKGKMATIGRRAAVVDAFGVHLSGFVAWVVWLFIHLMSLVGFRNRMVVLINWAYNYLTYDRGVRLITGKHHGSDWFMREVQRTLLVHQAQAGGAEKRPQ
ncbi:MAG: NAD(P)/FAD-dependent oxidoreductase [Chloroflexaceae bacterium]|nr:NAD(P)/FAD-dependent oxidoreductase [Chloroflexaceae bacterium]